MPRRPARRQVRPPAARAAALAVLAVLAAAVLPAGAPAAPASRPRIVGGQPASPGEYPYMAYLEITARGPFGQQEVFLCGGSLVAARYVVTAGHCVEGEVTRVDVGLGAIDVAGGFAALPAANRFPAATVIRNPAYTDGGTSGTPSNDAAVLRLPRPATGFAQLRLPRPADAALWAPGTGATAIGFGTTERGGASDVLLEVGLPIASDADCQAVYGPDLEPTTELCAGFRTPSGKDTCTGDSGGPLLVPDGFGGHVLAGATSFGPQQCGRTYGVYAEVGDGALNAWVRSVVPQVELDASASTVFTGEPVTVTAAAADPDGSGLFGGYDALSWDLDGDGTFGDASGTGSVTVAARAGTSAVSVLATDAAGNAEVRTTRITARDPSLVALATGDLTVTEGGAAALTLRKTGTGAGGLLATPSGAVDALDSPTAGVATFAAAEVEKTVTLQTREDRSPQASRVITVTLAGATGDLRVGTPSSLRITVRDDDAAVAFRGARTVRVRRGRFAVAVRPNRGGTLTATAVASGRTIASSPARRVGSAARRSLSLELTPRGRRQLARSGRLRVRVRVRIAPSGGGLATTSSRTVTLRG
jgi:secreted trypsin-like serine protease